MTHPVSPTSPGPNPAPQLPLQSVTLAGHSLETVRQTLLEHRWHTRRTARVLKVSYRALDAFRREHQVFSPVHLKRTNLGSGPAGSSATARKALGAKVLEPSGEGGSVHQEEGFLESLTQWARRQELSADLVKALRQHERITPLYRFLGQDQTTYYTRSDAQVLARGQRSPLQTLEGYQALHALERDFGPLRTLAQALDRKGTLRLVGAYPTLLSERDVLVLLEAHQLEAHQKKSAARAARRTAPHQASSPEALPETALERSLAAAPELTSPASESAIHPLEAVDSPPSRELSSALQLPFQPQAGFIVVPRFEVLHPETPAEIWDVYDRGAQGEHLSHPQHLARFYSEAVRQVFPHASLRRKTNSPPTDFKSIPPYPDPAAEGSTVNSVVDPACLPSSPVEGPPLEDLSAQQTTQQRELLDLLTHFEQENVQLEATLGELRAQLETAQRKLSSLEVLEHAHSPQLTTGGKSASQVSSKALLEALRERDALQVRLSVLETRLQDLEGDAHDPQGKRTRPYLLDHVRKQLSKRFHFRLTAERVRALDVEARAAPSVGYTRDGQPFKQITVEGQEVYAIVGQDEQGQPCLVTVYTRDMFDRAQVLKETFSTRM